MYAMGDFRRRQKPIITRSWIQPDLSRLLATTVGMRIVFPPIAYKIKGKGTRQDFKVHLISPVNMTMMV